MEDDDSGVVPIIERLRRIHDAVKARGDSGWMFPNTIGGALDLDNLDDRLIKPMLKAYGLKPCERLPSNSFLGTRRPTFSYRSTHSASHPKKH